MKARTNVNGKSAGVDSRNLRALCWARGFRGIPGLAKHIGRSRVTVWRAARRPDQFGPTYAKMLKALSQ